jgi:hypothetical protein
MDIANSQFAVLSNVMDNLDENFVDASKSGTLYKHISKETMFAIAFDKIRQKHTEMMSMFPNTLSKINAFKKKNGYKKFAVMLQQAESAIVIDQILPKLNGLDAITVHDAFWVKQSQAEYAEKIIKESFSEIEFECTLRTESKKVSFLYKGYSEVTREISKLDIKKFSQAMQQMIDEGDEPEEMLVYARIDFDRQKTWYLYNKWLQKHPRQIPDLNSEYLF